MSHFVPLSLNAHQGYAWLGNADYRFMADQGSIALVAQELPHALTAMPLGFRQSVSGGFELVAICALADQQNVFVHGDGRWLAPYKPALLRAYPFLLQKDAEQNQLLCIDEQSGLLVDEEQGAGQPLFNGEGKPSDQLSKLIDFLTQWEKQRRVTQQAVNMLAGFGVIVPWEVNMQTSEGEVMPGLKGYYRIDEAALNALPGKQQEALGKFGGLSIAYAQLFSQHRLSVLTRLYTMHKKSQGPARGDVDIESLFDSNDESISFDFDS